MGSLALAFVSHLLMISPFEWNEVFQIHWFNVLKVLPKFGMDIWVVELVRQWHECECDFNHHKLIVHRLRQHWKPIVYCLRQRCEDTFKRSWLIAMLLSWPTHLSYLLFIPWIYVDSWAKAAGQREPENYSRADRSGFQKPTWINRCERRGFTAVGRHMSLHNTHNFVILSAQLDSAWSI